MQVLPRKKKKLREEQRKRAARKKRKKIFKALIIILIIVAILGVVLWRFILIKKSKEAQNTLVTYTVERRTITEKLSATGTLQPADSYTVTSKVRGDILQANFEEGDEVLKDDILYVIDSGDMDSTIRQRLISLNDAKENLDELYDSRKELTAHSDLSGDISVLYVEVGDTIQKGAKVADIVDNSVMLVDIPFHAIHADEMDAGTELSVILEGSGERLTGTVTEISTISGTNAYGAPTKDVTISVSNPGGISKDSRATAELSEEVIGTDIGTFYFKVEEQLTSEYGGKIKTLYITEGGKVKENQKIIEFDSKDLDDQIKKAEESLETAQINYDDTTENLDDYNIRAPITGTVVEKNFNVGESIDTTGGNQTVAIIYDLSALVFDMSIDELDIFSIQKGQEVAISSDALKGETYYGSITKISKVGSTTNGTTTYPVTVTITDEKALERLLPGMNIDAEIVINRVENVIAVPTGAIARGNTVKVIKNPEALKAAQEKEAAEKKNGNTAGSGGPAGYTRPEGMPSFGNGEMPEGMPSFGNGEMPEGMPSFGNGEMPEGMPSFDRTAPAGERPQAQRNPNGSTSEIPAGNAFPAPSQTAEGNSEGVIPEVSEAPSTVESTEETTAPAGGQTAPMQGGQWGNRNGMMQNVQKPVTYGTAPADTEYETVKVETGISDDSFIEIISGLEEGDIIIIDRNQSSTATGFGMGMGGMPMGGMGGGMPMGGMGGGMPSGMPSGGMGANRNMGGANRPAGGMGMRN